jgi:hypothetical protein
MLNWKFFKPPPHKPDCDFAHDALTAAFDGQADDAQLAFAAQHRARCAHCQSLWSEWQKTRKMLRAVPVPMAPASLPEQILLTCRSLLDAELPALQNESAPARADLIAYLEAPDEEFSVARLAPFAVEVAPPPLLARQILERTAQAETPPRASLWPTIRGFFPGGSTRAVRAPLAARWGFGLAAPVLAAWLILAAQTSFVETPEPAVVRAPAALPDLKTVAPEPPEKFAALPGAKKTAPRVAAVPADAKAPTVKTRATKNVETAAPRAVEVSSAPPKIARKIRNTQKTVAKIVSLPRPRAIPLVDKTVSVQPKLARVALAPSARLSTKHPDVNLRNSAPVAVNSHAPAPRLADLRLVDFDFDESLSAIARQRDNRPEDLGRVLDEYSASLLAENTGENEEDEWG